MKKIVFKSLRLALDQIGNNGHNYSEKTFMKKFQLNHDEYQDLENAKTWSLNIKPTGNMDSKVEEVELTLDWSN